MNRKYCDRCKIELVEDREYTSMAIARYGHPMMGLLPKTKTIDLCKECYFTFHTFLNGTMKLD